MLDIKGVFNVTVNIRDKTLILYENTKPLTQIIFYLFGSKWWPKFLVLNLSSPQILDLSIPIITYLI